MTRDARLQAALCAALDDEFQARATYRKVLEHYGAVLPFANIVESEERHIVALERLFARYGIPLPDDAWPAKVAAPASLLAACQAGVEAERENAALYDGLPAATQDYPDVQATFRRLLAASQENHLPAFERCVARQQHRDSGHRDSRHRDSGHRDSGHRDSRHRDSWHQGPAGCGHRRRERHRGGRAELR